MAKGKFKKFRLAFGVAVLAVGGFVFYNYDLTSVFDKKTREVNEEAKTLLGPTLPEEFFSEAARAKGIDINSDGREEILLTTFKNGTPFAVLVDSADNGDFAGSKKLSEVFDFSVVDYPGSEFRSEEAPEVFRTLDLNGDGSEEIVIDLKDYGAYTVAYGILELRKGNLGWVILRDAGGEKRPAIFRDGSSVRNAEVFKVIEEGGLKAIAHVSGGSRDGINWFWEADAFIWDGGFYSYDADLSQKILHEQPKSFKNGEPIF